jgi:hypothetical protein
MPSAPSWGSPTKPMSSSFTNRQLISHVDVKNYIKFPSTNFFSYIWMSFWYYNEYTRLTVLDCDFIETI